MKTKNFIWKGKDKRRVPNVYDGYSALSNSLVLHRLKHVLPFVKRDQEVLELGCGVGWDTKFISLFCTKIYGLDIHKEAIEYAKKHNDAGNIKWITRSMTDLSIFPDSSIDLVVMIASIEHIMLEKVQIMLDEVVRVLKPNSILVGTTSPFGEKLKINTSGYHKYEPSIKALKDLIGQKLDIVMMENVLQKTWDTQFRGQEGYFILRTKEK